MHFRLIQKSTVRENHQKDDSAKSEKLPIVIGGPGTLINCNVTQHFPGALQLDTERKIPISLPVRCHVFPPLFAVATLKSGKPRAWSVPAGLPDQLPRAAAALRKVPGHLQKLGFLSGRRASGKPPRACFAVLRDSSVSL